MEGKHEKNQLDGRQDRILRGPMWSGCPPDDINSPLKAKVNVASVSQRTLQKRTEKSTEYTTTVSTIDIDRGRGWAVLCRILRNGNV